MASDDGEYEDNDGQSEVSEEEENGENDEDDENDENVVEMGADDEDLSAHWGAQRSIGNEFLSFKPSIHQQEFHFAPGAPGASDASGAPGANRCSGCVVAYSFRPDAYPTCPGAPDAPGRQPPSILHLLSALDFC